MRFVKLNYGFVVLIAVMVCDLGRISLIFFERGWVATEYVLLACFFAVVILIVAKILTPYFSNQVQNIVNP